MTYTYSYLFNPFLVAMAEEVISERTKEVSIADDQPDSAPIHLTPVSKTKKSSSSVAKLNSPTDTQEFSYDAIWREGITYRDVIIWITTPTVQSLAVEEYLMHAIHPASLVIYIKFSIGLNLLKKDYYQRVIRTLRTEHHYSYSQALQAIYWRMFSSVAISSTSHSISRSLFKEDGDSTV